MPVTRKNARDNSQKVQMSRAKKCHVEKKLQMVNQGEKYLYNRPPFDTFSQWQTQLYLKKVKNL